MSVDPYQAPSAEVRPDFETYLGSLLKRRRRTGIATSICGVLSVVVVIAGFSICDALADRRAAAGRSFDEVDQASDYLFLGIMLGFVFMIATLILGSRWLAHGRSIRTQRRLW